MGLHICEKCKQPLFNANNGIAEVDANADKQIRFSKDEKGHYCICPNCNTKHYGFTVQPIHKSGS
jgi:hypothetical protein